MNSLKAKFGKFAVSTEKMAVISGGARCYGQQTLVDEVTGEEYKVVALLNDSSYDLNSLDDAQSAVDACDSDPRCVGCW